MSESSKRKCSCLQEDEEKAAFPQIDNITKPCCENRTIELNNSNMLQKVTDEVNNLLKSSPYLASIIINETLLSQNNPYTEVYKLPPKLLTDILVSNSSLLI